MCGIAGIVGAEPERARVALEALAHRGPDANGFLAADAVALAHTRLSILDLDERSDQPFRYGQVTLAYNGELWNYRELKRELRWRGLPFETEGDTEVVAAALQEWGPDALPRLEGMFALAWHDARWPTQTLHLARDRFGEVPLHVAPVKGGWAFASELKALRAMGAARGEFWVEPGQHIELFAEGPKRYRWYEPPLVPQRIDLDEAAEELRRLIDVGARERAISDVPVCTLLSGGIDSAAVAFHLREYVPNLVGYVARMDEGPDVKAAREVAEALEIELVEVEVEPPTPEDIRHVVEVIEQPHKAQVEIGWACLKLAERVRADGHKVVFSGEGSDELWASYGFAYHALETQGQDWHRYRRDLFLGQHRKNFARCNKVFMAHGVECRLPFLHTSLVEFALSLPRWAVQDGRSKPKAVIQRAYAGMLPERVTKRPKLAFQDGLRNGEGNLKDAIAARVADPRRFYAAEWTRAYG